MFVKAGSNGCGCLLDDSVDFFTRVCVIDWDGGEGHGATHVAGVAPCAGGRCRRIKMSVEVLEVIGA